MLVTVWLIVFVLDADMASAAMNENVSLRFPLLRENFHAFPGLCSTATRTPIPKRPNHG